MTAETAVSSLPKCLPNPIGRRHYALADYKLCAHEHQCARPSHHRAPCLDEITDSNRVDKMHVGLDGRLRLARVGIQQVRPMARSANVVSMPPCTWPRRL